MQTKRWPWVLLLIIIVLVAGGYMLYLQFKDKPPAWLIELVTKTAPPPALPAGDLAPLTAPEGFTATIFARDVPGARVMTRDPKGTMLVSETGPGKIVALPDLDGDGKADKSVTVLDNLKQPHGISVVCPDTGNASADQDGCVLYVAETGLLKSYRYDADTYSASNPIELAQFPTGDGHFTRTLLPAKDNSGFFVSIGSSCNVCGETNPLRATIQFFSFATGKLETYATGLRNSVFMAYDPVQGAMWATDNGRDLLGDDTPPDDVNIIQKGKNYGWPICYGNNIHDTDFDKKQYFRDPCADSVPPQIALQAHSAALGLAFVPEEGWPEDMRNDLLIAFHGSWNRSTPTGYKVVRYNLDAKRAAVGGPIDFLTGFLGEGKKPDDAIGRPVGLMAEPGGVVYVSDDRAGAIYKISYRGNQP